MPEIPASYNQHCVVCGEGERSGGASDYYCIKTDQMPQWNKKQTIQQRLEEVLGVDLNLMPGISDRMCELCVVQILFFIREAFTRKNREKFGVLPKWGYHPPFSKLKKFGKFPFFSGTFFAVF